MIKQRIGKIGSEHIKSTMGQIQYPGDRKNQGKPRRYQCVNAPLDASKDDDFFK
jgi:hypothetical protein